MKKLYVLAMVLTLAACFAYASTMSVPWFTDNAPAGCGLPPTTGLVAGKAQVGLVYLHNNLNDELVCSIEYFTQEGDSIGPLANNTFTLPALATVAFRPTVHDPVTPGTKGMESVVAQAIPNRPTVDGKDNGSFVITWSGDPGLVQGVLLQTQNANRSADMNAANFLQWGTLLPAGIDPDPAP